MYSRRSGDNWSDPKNLGILPDSVVAAHPSLSPDGLTLYFVSDIGGGSGKKDIWKVTRTQQDQEPGANQKISARHQYPGDELFPSQERTELSILHPTGR